MAPATDPPSPDPDPHAGATGPAGGVGDAPFEDDGLLFACRLDGAGGARALGWDAIEGAAGDGGATATGGPPGALWVHLRRDSPRARAWLASRPWIDALTVEALLAESTRPRIVEAGAGTVAILRGVDHRAGVGDGELLSFRVYCDGERLVSVRRRRLQVPHELYEQLLSPTRGPRDVPTLFERLISRLTERMSETVLAFDERLDDVEASVDAERPGAGDARRELSTLRRRVVAMRRHVYPQREALTSFLQDPPDWLGERPRAALRETHDRLVRYVEELDAARERALVIRDDIQNRLAERTNRILFALSILSAVFLPLTFLTGLLGMNVGGLPGTGAPAGFALACALMLAVGAVELLVLWRLGWLRPPRRDGARGGVRDGPRGRTGGGRRDAGRSVPGRTSPRPGP